MPQLTTKQLSFFKPDPKQARQHYDEAEDRRLGESMLARGQLQPVVAAPDGTMRYGHRRLRGAILVGMKELQVIISDRPLSDTEIRLIQLTENMHRADLTGHEKWLACAELMCMNPGWQITDLTNHLHLSPSMGTRLLSPSKCIEAAQHALRDGKIGISDCYAISKVPESEQAALLAMKLSGASRDAIEQAGRTSRTRNVPAVKLSRVKCPLASGVVIVASGEGLSLDDLIDALGEAQKEAKKAREQGLDAKTFQAVMRDRAKAR
jgi:ParB/RepB/Spo0J family partition protein